MKKIILILFTTFCTNSFAGMYQKTQGNSQALPANNAVTPTAQSFVINVNPSSINVSGSAALSVTGAQGVATYSVTSGSCTVSGSTITAGSSSGTCTVVASIPASTYFLASSATTTITITAPQNQVITSFYIEPNFLSLSTTTYLRVSGTNLGNVSFSVISGPCVLFQGNRLYSDSTGNCVIRATTAANGSYASTTQNLTITVTN